MSKKGIFSIYILCTFVSLCASDAYFAAQAGRDKYDGENYVNGDNNLNKDDEKNTKKEDAQSTKYSVNVFNYDETVSKHSWFNLYLKNNFFNTYYSLSNSVSNPWHLIAFPVNIITTCISGAFFKSNLNSLFFQKLNLLVSFKNFDTNLYNYLEHNINQDTKFYEENIYANQDIIKGIGVTHLIDFRNEFQKQIAEDINGETLLTDRINDFINTYTLKGGLNLEQYYKTTLKYRILSRLGLKDKSFEEQRVREFLFTYLKTSIMFSLDAKYSYEYTVFRNNFFYTGKDDDFVKSFGDFKYIFSKSGQYSDSDYYDMMDYFAWKISNDEAIADEHNIPNINSDYYVFNYKDKVLNSSPRETNKLFATSSEYQKMDFCFKCGAMGQKLVRWGISGAFLCMSYKVLLHTLATSGLFWLGSSALITASVVPVVSGITLEHKKTKNFKKFMTENVMNSSKYVRINDVVLNTDAGNSGLGHDNSYAENKAKTDAKLLNIVKHQEKMICDNSDKNVAVKVPVMESIMNDYNNYINSNRNSTKTISELTNEFKQKLREEDFAMIREKSSKESKFSDKFTKIFSKIFYSVKSFLFGEVGEKPYIDYQKKYNYVSQIIDSVESYTMVASYHNALLNMYDDFMIYGNKKSFTDFFEANWMNYLNSEIKTKSNNKIYTIKKEFKGYALEHIILDGLYDRYAKD